MRPTAILAVSSAVVLGSVYHLTALADEPPAATGSVTSAAEPTRLPPPTVDKSIRQVVLKARLIEISRTKMRELGFDFAWTDGQGLPLLKGSTVTGLLAEPGKVDSDRAQRFDGFLNALRENKMARMFAEPTIVVTSNHPSAQFRSGQDLPVRGVLPNGEPFNEIVRLGTEGNCQAVVLDDGRIEVNYRISYRSLPDSDRKQDEPDKTLPGYHHCVQFDTSMVLKSGETGIASQISTRRTPDYRSDGKVVKVEYNMDEYEAVLLLTPELVGEERTAATDAATEKR